MVIVQRKALLTFMCMATFVLAFDMGIMYWVPYRTTLSYLLTIAVTIDFLLAIPAIFYVQLLRNRIKDKPIPIQLIRMAPVIFIGFFIVSFLIPNTNSVVLTIARNLLICLELFIISFEIYKVYQAIHFVRLASLENSHFIDSVRIGLSRAFDQSKLATFLTHDISVWYYSLFAWRKKEYEYDIPQARIFSYHNESSLIVMSLILIKVMLLEGIAMHFLVHPWSNTFAWITSLGHVYCIIIVIAELRASTLNPIVLRDDSLRVRYGLQICADIALSNIEEITMNSSTFEVSKEVSKEKMKTTIAPIFPKSNIHIRLQSPIKAIGYLGLQKQITELYLFVDDPKRFGYEISQNLKK